MKPVREWLQRFSPYFIALAVLVLLRTTGLAQTVDLLIYDLVTSQRPAASGKDTPITLIGIAESDIKKFGWPIDDGLFCKAFDQLNDAGVAVIGFDIYRDQGVGEQQQCLRDRFRDEPNLVSIFNVSANIGPVPGTPPERQSYNDLSIDADGILPRDLIHVTGQDEATVSFALRVTELATGDRSLRDAMNAGTHHYAWLTANSGGYHNEVEAGLGIQRLLRFRKPWSYRQHTLEQLLAGTIPVADIKDKIFLIGSTAPSLRDLFHVPHTQFHQGKDVFQISGVEIHANRIATLLDRRNNTLTMGWMEYAGMGKSAPRRSVLQQRSSAG